MGLISGVISLISFVYTRYDIITAPDSMLKSMNLSQFCSTYLAIIPILGLLVYFILMLKNKKNNSVSKSVLIGVWVLNIIIYLIPISETSKSAPLIINIISLVPLLLYVLILVYLIKVLYVPKIPYNRIIILVIFGILDVYCICSLIYSFQYYVNLPKSDALVRFYIENFVIYTGKIVSDVLLAIYLYKLSLEDKTI